MLMEKFEDLVTKIDSEFLIIRKDLKEMRDGRRDNHASQIYMIEGWTRRCSEPHEANYVQSITGDIHDHDPEFPGNGEGGCLEHFNGQCTGAVVVVVGKVGCRTLEARLKPSSNSNGKKGRFSASETDTVWKSVRYGVSKDWIRRIGDFLERKYAVSSLMDTAYWSSE
ncbi:hypothetical protein Tco_0525233 [Tanacetum coccineum]